MRLIAARMLFVLSALTVPQFIEGGRLVFLPSVNLWRWGNDAVNGHGSPHFAVNNPDFLWNVLLFFAVPLGFALWFRLGDMLRYDIKSIQKRSKYIIHLMLPAFSWIAMVFTIIYSVNHGGPLAANHWYTSNLLGAIHITALALLTIEYLTYFISSGKG